MFKMIIAALFVTGSVAFANEPAAKEAHGTKHETTTTTTTEKAPKGKAVAKSKKTETKTEEKKEEAPH